MNKPVMVFTRVTVEIRNLVEKVAEAQGLTISEYVRSLIIKDLEEKNIISTKLQKLKEEIRSE